MLTKVAKQSFIPQGYLRNAYRRLLPRPELDRNLSSSWRFTFRNLVKVADISCMGIAFLLAGSFVTHGPAADGAYVIAGSIGALLAFLYALQNRVYTRRALQSLSFQSAGIVVGLFVGTVGQCVVLWTLHTASITSITQWALAWFGISALVLLGFRVPLVSYIRAATRSGLLARRLAIVGATEKGFEIAAKLSAVREQSNHLVGIFDDAAHLPAYSEFPVDQSQALGTISDLVALSRREQLDTIVVALPLPRMHEIDVLRSQLGSVIADVYVVPDISGLSPSVHPTYLDPTLSTMIGGNPGINIIRRPLTDYQSIQKALFDKAVALAALIVLMPILLLIALAIRTDSRGPIFFRQPRMGFNNVPFTVFKFRSMYHHMADILADRQTSRDDPRVTRVGRILRKLSFDELPQLINVLRGDMSLVGPRPHAPRTKAEGQLLEDTVAEYAERHRMKPGITGWAQVNGSRGEIRSIGQIQERVRFDLHYIRNWSLLFDVKILFLTLTREIISLRAF